MSINIETSSNDKNKASIFKFLDENVSLTKAIGIEELGLSKIAYNSLKRAGIDTIFDVFALIQKGKLSKVRNIGVVGEKDIIEKLTSFLEVIKNELPPVSPFHSGPIDEVGLLFPPEIINNLSVNVLIKDIGEDMVNNLLNANIYTLGELNDLVKAYLKIMNSKEVLLDAIISQMIEEVKTMINHSGLQVGITVSGKTLTNILYSVPQSLTEKFEKLILLNTILKTPSLDDELELIYQPLSEREKELFLINTLEKTTYQNLDEKYSISKDRIRQIINEAIKKLCENLQKQPTTFLHSACLIADNLGEDLNQEKLKDQLTQIGLLKHENPTQYQGNFNLLLALMTNERTSFVIELSNTITE